MGNCTNKSKHIPTHTLWRLSVSQGSPHNYSSVPAGFASLECKHGLNLTDFRLMSKAAGQTDLCQESPSSLLTDHNEN